jgi:nucleotide-binding universal stress UspA family protein
MFHRIIVPLDGTPFAEAALAPARALARAFEARILVVRAAPDSSLPLVTSAVEESRIEAALERVDEADAYLHEIMATLRQESFDADLLLSLASPGAGIARAAELSHADLIVMATHLRWNAALDESESTTLQLLRTTRVPILAWRSGMDPTTQGKTPPQQASIPAIARPDSPIVVPLDGSRFAARALPAAEALARAFQSYLVLVQAVSLGTSSTSGQDEVDERVQQRVQELQRAEGYLQHLQEGLAARGVPASTIARAGAVLGVITNAVQEFDASLIVMASHGQSGLADRFLGSVAAHILEEANVPTLVIRSDATPEQC